MLETISGIPAHPLFVHIPVVIIPLTALVLLLWALVPRWSRQLAGPAVALSTLGALAVWPARISGEALMEAKGYTEANPGPIATHADWANYATAGAIALFVVALGMFVLWRRSLRGGAAVAGASATRLGSGALGAVMRVVVAVIAVVVVYVAVRTGHEGALLTWKD